ncbi:rust resistance kinase Lr10-like [Salvia divinorum]|uniref:Rust resistance kinase Lr10-like n=1 Tax=Salvia divinorum TaxID=28513 RepID=A0ABD1H9H0_SALDI
MITTHQDRIFLTTSSLLMILSLHNLFESCDAKCAPSSCGIIHNISYPFRLKGDSNKCGDPRFEFSCENNVTSISLNSHKYYVKAINYSGYRDVPTIRVVDASINKDDIYMLISRNPRVPLVYCGTSKILLIRRDYLLILVVILGMLCAAVSPHVFTICGFAAVTLLLFHIRYMFQDIIETFADTVQLNPLLAIVVVIIDLSVLLPKIFIFRHKENDERFSRKTR